jgi:hypothetical protein
MSFRPQPLLSAGREEGHNTVEKIKSSDPARNGIQIPRTSSLYISHYTDWTIPSFSSWGFHSIFGED